MCKREEMEKIAEQNIQEVESNWQEQGMMGQGVCFLMLLYFLGFYV